MFSCTRLISSLIRHLSYVISLELYYILNFINVPLQDIANADMS